MAKQQQQQERGRGGSERRGVNGPKLPTLLPYGLATQSGDELDLRLHSFD